MSDTSKNPRILEKGYCGYTYKRPRIRIDDITDLKTGDHICFKRKHYEHHGIVSNIFLDDGIFFAVEVLGVSILDKLKGNSMSHVSNQKHHFSKVKGTVYVVEYAEGECFSPAKVIDSANYLLGKYVKYNLRTMNCEHYASAMKTGKGLSEQVESFAGLSCKMSKSSANSFEFVINVFDEAIEGTPCCASDVDKCEEMDENESLEDKVCEDVGLISSRHKRKSQSEPEEPRKKSKDCVSA